MTVLIGGIVFVLAYVRRVDVVELFGLTRLSTPKLLPLVDHRLRDHPAGRDRGQPRLEQPAQSTAYGAKPEQQELVTILSEADSLPIKLLIAFSACIFAPISEEVLFRGYFYPTLKRHSERFFAAIVVSLLFAVVHSNTMSVLPLFVLAMSFTIAYELTGCLLTPSRCTPFSTPPRSC